MPKNVKASTISYEEASKYLGLIPLPELKIKHDFVEGDHWGLNGEYWIGWRPHCDKNGNISDSANEQWRFIVQGFKSKNVIGSNIKRVIGAIIGNEPEFDLTEEILGEEPSAEKSTYQKELDRLDAIITNWWTRKGIHQVLKDYLKNRLAYGKASILITVPTGYLEERETNGEKQLVFADANSFEDFLDTICVKVLSYKEFIDVEDEDFGTKFTVVQLAPMADGTERIGIFYVDTDKRSYFRIVMPNKTEDNKISCDIGQNNLCITVGDYCDSIVTKDVISLQKSVNHAKTGEDFALANINFPETTFINAMPFEDAQGNIEEPKQGVGIIRFLRGKILETINGQIITEPSIHQREGADPAKFSQVANENSEAIDELMGLSYKNATKSEYTSGRSKERSMDDWNILKLETESDINMVGQKVIENVVRLCLFFTKKTSDSKKFKVLFKSVISTGEVTNEDKATMLEEVKLGARSLESYMMEAKVSDNPITEIQRIQSQPKLLTENMNNGNGNGNGGDNGQ